MSFIHENDVAQAELIKIMGRHDVLLVRKCNADKYMVIGYNSDNGLFCASKQEWDELMMHFVDKNTDFRINLSVKQLKLYFLLGMYRR